jgi:hypothetical protein
MRQAFDDPLVTPRRGGPFRFQICCLPGRRGVRYPGQRPEPEPRFTKVPAKEMSGLTSNLP